MKKKENNRYDYIAEAWNIAFEQGELKTYEKLLSVIRKLGREKVDEMEYDNWEKLFQDEIGRIVKLNKERSREYKIDKIMNK